MPLIKKFLSHIIKIHYFILEVIVLYKKIFLLYVITYLIFIKKKKIYYGIH